MQGGVGVALLVNVVLFGAALKTRALTYTGASIMGLMGFWYYLALGWRGYLIPIVFFVLGSLFTRLGYETKRSRQAAQKNEGKRGVREVLANGAVPLLLTLPIILVDAKLFTLGFIGAWATALCDTSATELGSLWGKRSFYIKNLRLVPPGTPGAVSLEGTVAGFVAALLLVIIAYVLGLISVNMVLPLSFAALVGSLIESYLAEIIPSGCRARHEVLNLSNTAVGGGLALILGGVVYGRI